MKLSEAIREGCKTSKQGFGSLYRFGKDGSEACAFGTAGIGFGVSPRSYVAIEDAAREQAGVDCELTDTLSPATGAPAKLTDLILDLNDNYQWTREEIADWLEGLGY